MPASATCDFRILHGTANSARCTSPAALPWLKHYKQDNLFLSYLILKNLDWYSVTAIIQSAENHIIFSFVLSNAVVETVRVRINAIPFIFFEAVVRTFEIRILLLNIIVTRIDDTFPTVFGRLTK